MQRVEIRFRGHINRDWSDRLGGLTINHIQDGSTVLSGPMRDQAALYGLLLQLSSLGLQLISVLSENMDNNGQGGSGMKAKI
jgi:hypothetical protein